MEIFSLLTAAIFALVAVAAVYKMVRYVTAGGLENRYTYVEDAEGNVLKVNDLRDAENAAD